MVTVAARAAPAGRTKAAIAAAIRVGRSRGMAPGFQVCGRGSNPSRLFWTPLMRRSVIVALLLAALACAAAAPAGARVRSHDVLFVANSSDGTVTLIDAHTFRRLGVL